MVSISRKKNMKIGRIVGKIVATVIALYAGGIMMTTLGTVMNATTSPFYQGLSLIGWTVNATGTITSTSGSGILAVIGVIGIASIVTEFVDISF